VSETYKAPKAKKIYVIYDVDDPDDLIAFRTPTQAAENIAVGEEDVVGIYELTGLLKIEKKVQVVCKPVKSSQPQM
jgi:hypothetical protein